MVVHRHTVLIVEDDADTRDALKAFVSAEGCDPLAAANGREALDLLRRVMRPCVILLDLALPEMNGFEFRRAQLADPDLAPIPVVVLSAGGYANEADARKIGLTTFFRKPPDLEEVLAAIRTHCVSK